MGTYLFILFLKVNIYNMLAILAPCASLREHFLEKTYMVPHIAVIDSMKVTFHQDTLSIYLFLSNTYGELLYLDNSGDTISFVYDSTNYSYYIGNMNP